MKILHITDFHIDSPDGDNENLRKGYYEEFIDGLFTIIAANNISQIDLIVNTGDFVNVGKTENYEHAKRVLDYISQKAKLSPDNIATCIGNHDFKMKEPGTRDEKIKPYLEFSKDYSPGKKVEQTDRAVLYEEEKNGVQILVIDNASIDTDLNQPAELSTGELDDIIKIARHNLSQRDLIVISHYPMIGFPMSKYVAEDPDWGKNHVWKAGHNVQHRLATLRPQGKTIFLCGDGHIPDAFQNETKQFIMTGLFGGNYTKRSFGGKPVFMQTQARVIDTEKETKLFTFNYKPAGFEYDVSHGTWAVEISSLRQLLEKQHAATTSGLSRTSALSDPLEKEIIARVTREQLYKLGRYKTSSDVSSLSWISINRLFEEQQLVVSLIDKALEWLEKIIKDPSKGLLIGVDFYGAIISTHLSVRIGMPNHCFTSRYLSVEDYDAIPSILKVIASVNGLKDIVFVTDVVSSGQSLLRVIKVLEQKYKELNGSDLAIKYHSISVISDANIDRAEFDEKLSSIKTACAALRMPIVKESELPGAEILPNRLDFTN